MELNNQLMIHPRNIITIVTSASNTDKKLEMSWIQLENHWVELQNSFTTNFF